MLVYQRVVNMLRDMVPPLAPNSGSPCRFSPNAGSALGDGCDGERCGRPGMGSESIGSSQVGHGASHTKRAYEVLKRTGGKAAAQSSSRDT